MGENENTTPEQAPEKVPETAPAAAAVAENLANAGLSKDEIAEVMREVLKEQQAPAEPVVDVAAAEKEYFGSFIKK